VGRRATFDVAGEPHPQGSKKGFLVDGFVRIVDDNPPKLRKWRKAVKVAAADQAAAGVIFPLGIPLHVTLTFRLPRLKTMPVRKRIWPTGRPDVDKLQRSTFDAMVDGGLIGDDSQIVGVRAVKDYTPVGEGPGCRVVVAPAPAWEEQQQLLAAQQALDLEVPA
jgi:Holliday junction resolvase RusA-like endonuclease